MLEIKNLTKRYGNFYAIRNLNLTVEDGELFGFVGANGAGKTTTMRICVGLLGADSGEVFIDGKRMLSNHKLLSNKVGYVPDFFGVYNAFTSMEYLQFFAAAYGLVGGSRCKRPFQRYEAETLPRKGACTQSGYFIPG